MRIRTLRFLRNSEESSPKIFRLPQMTNLRRTCATPRYCMPIRIIALVRSAILQPRISPDLVKKQMKVAVMAGLHQEASVVHQDVRHSDSLCGILIENQTRLTIICAGPLQAMEVKKTLRKNLTQESGTVLTVTLNIAVEKLQNLKQRIKISPAGPLELAGSSHAARMTKATVLKFLTPPT